MADGSVIIDTKLDDSGIKKGVSGLKGNFSKLGSKLCSYRKDN